MGVIVVLIGFSLLVALGFLAAFIWSVKDGQYDDDYAPSIRILFEDSPAKEKSKHKSKKTKTKINN